MKYELKDFEDVVNGKSTIEVMCERYKVSRQTFIRSMNKKGFFIKKVKLKIITPTKTKVVSSISECAYELKVSDKTIRNYLKGKRIKLFDELSIHILVLEGGSSL